MKKLFLSAAIVLGSLGAFAQGGLGYGLRAGVNIPSYSYGGSDLSDSKSTVNFHVTGYLDAPLAPNFSVQPGISLQGKGAKFADYEIGGNTYEVKQNTMWLEVPVNFVAKLPTGDSGNLFVGAGPYVGFGLSGKNKLDRTNGSDTETVTETDFKFGKDETLKGTDFGFNFIAGYQLSSGFSINAGYGLGLTNLSGDKFLGSGDVKNRVWSVGIGIGL